MKIYFVQHGKAGDIDRDGERHLTVEGRSETSIVASHMKRVGISIQEILHSGKMRARETAEIFGGKLSVKRVGSIDGMNPMDSTKDFVQNIDRGDVMYVGHLPHLEKTVALLVTGNHTTNPIKVKNSGVICLQGEENQWEIAWYLTPELVEGR